MKVSPLVVAESGWFAARLPGTEDIYKIYVESVRGTDHLRRILDEAQTIVRLAVAEAVPQKHVQGDLRTKLVRFLIVIAAKIQAF